MNTGRIEPIIRIHKTEDRSPNKNFNAKGQGSEATPGIIENGDNTHQNPGVDSLLRLISAQAFIKIRQS